MFFFDKQEQWGKLPAPFVLFSEDVSQIDPALSVLFRHTISLYLQLKYDCFNAI